MKKSVCRFFTLLNHEGQKGREDWKTEFLSHKKKKKEFKEKGPKSRPKAYIACFECDCIQITQLFGVCLTILYKL